MAMLGTTHPTVRLRCMPCEVAWSGPAESTCWVCGGEGEGLRTAVRLYEADELDFDFDLI